MAISARLRSLIEAKYETSHYHNKEKEKAYFCFDCGGESLTHNEYKESHNEPGHRVISAYKDTGRYTYRVKELHQLALDCPELQDLIPQVCVYRHNYENEMFLRTSLIHRRENFIGKKDYCDNCGKIMRSQQIQTRSVRYCSLGCGVGLLGVLETPKTASSSNNNNNNLTDKKRKRKREQNIDIQMLDAEVGYVHPNLKWGTKRSRSGRLGETQIEQVTTEKDCDELIKVDKFDILIDVANIILGSEVNKII